MIAMAAPMLVGVVSVMLFNLVDTFYVGQLGPAELAAMGFTFPVVFIITSLSMGIGIGLSSVTSKAIGEGNHGKVQNLVSNGLLLVFLMVFFFSILGYFTIDEVFSLLGATPDLIPMISQYMSVFYLGIMFLVLPMVANSAIRATGDTKTPSLIMVISGMANVILSPLMIFGIGPFPELRLFGAALSSVISWMLMFVFASWILVSREKMIIIPTATLQSWREILYIGLPAAATNLLIPLSSGILVRMVSDYGPDAVAGFGVGTRIESLTLTGIFALAIVITPFVGQNYGARNRKRIIKALEFVRNASLVYGAAVFIILQIIAEPLASIFNSDPDVVKTIIAFITTVPISYGFYGVVLTISSSFNALHRPLYSTLLVFLRLFVLAIPLAYLGSSFFGLEGIFYGIVVANVLMMVIAVYLARRVTETL